MTDQEQVPPIDLAEGERLLAEFRAARVHFEAVEAMNRYDQPRQWPDAMDRLSRTQQALVNWLYYDENNFEAMVTALKARDGRIAELLAIKAPTQIEQDQVIEIEQLRADLARVEAESKHNGELATGYFKSMGEYATQLTAAQARIAELEGSLRGVYETHGRADDGPCWCGDCERARANLPAQTPSAS